MDIYMSPFIMHIVLRDSLDDSQIVKLSNSCGIVYPGSRTKSVPMEQLIDDLADDFHENVESKKIILKALKKANTKTVEEIKGYSPKEIGRRFQYPGTWMKEYGLGKVIYALNVDRRPKVNRFVDDMVYSVEEHASLMLDTFEDDIEKHFDDNYIAEIEDRIKTLGEENKKILQREDKLKERVEILETKLEGKKNQFVSLRRDLSDKSATLKKVQAEVRALSKERDKLELKLKKMEEKPDEPSLIRNTHQLIRDIKKLHHDVEKVLENPRQVETGGSTSYLTTLGNEIERFRRVTDENKRAVDDQLKNLYRSIQDMAKKIDFLYASERGVMVEKEKKIKERKGPPRLGVFVDVQNLYYAAKRLGARIDYERLLSAAVGQRRLVRAIAYVVQTPEVDQSGFISMLQQKNYEVRRKDLRVRSDGSAKGDWDMGIAVDIMELVDKLDVVVIVSGDGDFVALVHLIKTRGPRVEVFSITHNTSKDLIEAADAYCPISEGMLLK